MVKNLPANAGDIRDEGSIPGSGRSPVEGNVNPLQYSCLEKHMVGYSPWGRKELDTTESTWNARTNSFSFIHSINIAHYMPSIILSPEEAILNNSGSPLDAKMFKSLSSDSLL